MLGKTWWLYADAQGRRLFTGVSIGDFQAVARAPGYEETVQPLNVQAGLMNEATLLLRPQR